MSDRMIILNDRTRFGGETGAGLMANRCAFTSKDMAEEWDAAFTYAIVFGWDDPTDEEDDGGTLREQAEKWGWDEPLVAFLRDAHQRFAALPQREDI